MATVYREVDVEIDIELDEFTNSDIYEEADARGLLDNHVFSEYDAEYLLKLLYSNNGVDAQYPGVNMFDLEKKLKAL